MPRPILHEAETPRGIAFFDGKQEMTMLVLKWVDENGLQARWQKVSGFAQPETTGNRSLTRSDGVHQLPKRDVA